MSKIILQTDNLTKNFGKVTAVQSVNLRVQQGEVFGFLGPNGAEKTTTIGMVLGLGAALLHRPALIILDEPTNGLDPAGMREVRTLIRQLTDEGTTVFLSSHLLHEVEQVCDRIAVIRQGQIVAQGGVEELLSQSGQSVKLKVKNPAKAGEILAQLPDATKILWLEIAVMAAAAVLIPLVIYLANQSDGSGNLVIITDGPVEEMIVWPLALRLGIDLASGGGLGGLLIVILIGTLTAQEYGWRTMQLWLSNGISRPVLLLAKFTAVLLPALLLVLAPFIAGALTTAVFTQNLQGSLPFAQVDWWQTALSIGRTAFTLLPYTLLFVGLAILAFRHQDLSG